jgi:hypothetical protein
MWGGRSMLRPYNDKPKVKSAGRMPAVQKPIVKTARGTDKYWN